MHTFSAHATVQYEYNENAVDVFRFHVIAYEGREKERELRKESEDGNERRGADEIRAWRGRERKESKASKSVQKRENEKEIVAMIENGVIDSAKQVAK